MIRGTTPTYTFEVPVDMASIKSVRITYAQGRNIVLTKQIEDCTMQDGTITVTLTQQETLRFAESANVGIQLRVLMDDGLALSTSVMYVTVGACLDNEVIE